MSKKRGKKLFKNFEKYKEKIEQLEGKVPKEFAKVAKRAGIKFINTAKDLTDEEKLVDTGTYKRNWSSDVRIFQKMHAYVVKCFNPIEYASHLEYGHRIKKSEKKTKGKFVGTRAVEKAREFMIKEAEQKLGDLFKIR